MVYFKIKTQEMYLGPEEVIRERKNIWRQLVPKVIALCAATRPQYSYNTKRHFDDKTGLWPSLYMIPPHRFSRNCSTCTFEMKLLTVNQEINRLGFIERCTLLFA